MIVDQEQINLLKKNALFHSVDQSFVESFVKLKNFFMVGEGNLLYSTNDDSTCIFLIVKGEVKIKFNGAKTIKYKYLLDFFGEKEVLDKSPRNSSAITNNECVLYRMSLEEMNSIITIYPNVQNNLQNNDKQRSNLNETLIVQA